MAGFYPGSAAAATAKAETHERRRVIVDPGLRRRDDPGYW
jgi:hypothetical protein